MQENNEMTETTLTAASRLAPTTPLPAAEAVRYETASPDRRAEIDGGAGGIIVLGVFEQVMDRAAAEGLGKLHPAWTVNGRERRSPHALAIEEVIGPGIGRRLAIDLLGPFADGADHFGQCRFDCGDIPQANQRH